MVAQKFDGSRFRKRHGRPPTKADLEDLVVRLARENPAWGYDRIAGAIVNLGHCISDQTVGNILLRNGLGASPEQRRNTTWASFIRQHRDALGATDFFTTEIWTRWGLTTYHVLFFIHVRSRRIVLGGMSQNLNAFAERFVKTIKTECLEQFVLFGENSLRHAIREYLAHDHAERNHQGIENVPSVSRPTAGGTGGEDREGGGWRLGGLLNFYHRQAA